MAPGDTNQPDPSGPRAAAANVTGGAVGPVVSVNPQEAAAAERVLTQSASIGYLPSLPIVSARGGDFYNYQFWEDLELMRIDAAISQPLEYVMGCVHQAEFSIEASSPEVAKFVADGLQWWFSNAVPQIQEDGYAVGWSAGEPTYGLRDGLLHVESFSTFAARDCDPLVMPDGTAVGIHIRNSSGEPLRLNAWRDDVPNKGYWYAHRPRHGLRRGRSQIRTAWRPWRRLTGRDGAEEILDLGVYRHGVPPTVVDHPNLEQHTKPEVAPSWATGGRWNTRDEAAQISQMAKSGAGIALSSEQKNGVRLWDFRIIDTKINIESILKYIEHLEQKCSKAILFPPELVEASETGSGYSGREIPLDAFLQSQQRPLNDLTRGYEQQIALPLVKWNFGPSAWVRITAKSLLQSFKNRQNGQGPTPMPPPPPPPPPAAAPTQPDPNAPPPGAMPDPGSPGPVATMSAAPTGGLVDFLASLSISDLESVANGSAIGY